MSCESLDHLMLAVGTNLTASSKHDAEAGRGLSNLNQCMNSIEIVQSSAKTIHLNLKTSDPSAISNCH